MTDAKTRYLIHNNNTFAPEEPQTPRSTSNLDKSTASFPKTPTKRDKTHHRKQRDIFSSDVPFSANNPLQSRASDEPTSQMASQTPPGAERSASPRKAGLRLDLSALPPSAQPSPPSNTLLITDLHDLRLFQSPAIDTLKDQISATAPLNSFSPLPSFRRIVCSFTTIDDAIKIRQLLDGDALLGNKKVRARVYFGEPTPVETVEEARKRKLLEAPHSEKLFFISPPPSPPHGWILRNEDPPNKEVHAQDLAEALNKLGREQDGEDSQLPETPVSAGEGARSGTWTTTASDGFVPRQRSRSSTLIYDPQHHGNSPGLPAVMVEDTSVGDESDMDVSPIDGPHRRFAHTSRPPIELME